MVWTHVRWMGTLHLGILSSTVLDGKLLTFKSLSSTWTRFFFFFYFYQNHFAGKHFKIQIFEIHFENK